MKHRTRLILITVLLLLMGGLKAAAPAAAACGGVTIVSDAAELSAAITAYNAQAGPCIYEIELEADITLTEDLLIIGNTTPGVEMIVDGAGFTLDADGWAAFHAEGGVLTVKDITIIDAFIEAIFADSQVTLRVSRVNVVSAINGIYLLDSEGVITDSTISDGVNGILHERSNFQPTPQMLVVINSTVAGNDVTGIEAGSNDLTVTNTTITGSDIGVYVSNAVGVINNSIIAGNGSDCELSLGTIDVNFSLVQNDSPDFPCGVTDGVDGNVVGEDPLLLPLGDYGGSTPTAPPAEYTGSVTITSPALDAGSNALSVDDTNTALTTDQRGAGFPRQLNGVVDMGAVEGPVSIDCPTFPATVVNEAELNTAIHCYNAIPAAGTYTIELGADILLTAATRAIDNDRPGVSLTILGNDHDIDGQDIEGTRPIFVEENSDVTIERARLVRGNPNDATDGGNGGGVHNRGNLSLNTVNVEENTSTNDGGGIFNEDGATLTLMNSHVGTNLATFPGGDGGGISNDGYMTIIESSIVGNKAQAHDGVWAGGVWNEGVMTILRSTIATNSAIAQVDFAKGGGIANQANLVIRDSTISTNLVEAGDNDAYGGGIYSEADPEEVTTAGYGTQLLIINSTISTNSVVSAEWVLGGGLYATGVDSGCCIVGQAPVKLINTTLTGNTIDATTNLFHFGGGALFAMGTSGTGPAVTIHNTILADNATVGGVASDCTLVGTVAFESRYSLYEADDYGACDLPAANPDGNGNIIGQDPALGPLSNYGGLTETHRPAANSAAVNAGSNALAVDESANPLLSDQRGYVPRVVGGRVDMGSVEVGARESAGGGIYLSATAAGTTDDGVAFGFEDILVNEEGDWSLWFDGSAAGLMPKGTAKHNINAFWIPNPADEDVVMSFAQNARVVPGIGPKVDGMDLVWWDGAAFSLWFDGSDVGLTVKTAEKIDGLHVQDGSESPIGGSCEAYLLISTQGPGKVPNHTGGTLSFGGEDVLGFCAFNLGADTTGIWHMVLDGSQQGMPRNSTDSISLSADGQTLYLTTKGTFNLDAATGGHSMVYAYDIATTQFSGPHFIAPAEGLPKKVDGLHMEQ